VASEGYVRCYVFDPFGNRVEFMQVLRNRTTSGNGEGVPARGPTPLRRFVDQSEVEKRLLVIAGP